MANTSEVATKKPELPGAFSLFQPSVDALMLNIGTFLGLYLVPILVLLVLVGITGGITLVSLASSHNSVAGLGVGLLTLGVLISIVVALIFAPALPYTQLKSVKGEKINLSEAIKGGLKYFWRFIGLSIVVGLVVFVGLLLFIVPGIIFIRRYYLSVYYLIDQDLKIFEAMTKSAADTKPRSGAIWGVVGVQFLCGLSGVIPIFGGLISFVLNFLYSCAMPLRYIQIKEIVSKNAS